MSVRPVSMGVWEFEREKKGDWSEFENSNQPIGEADVEKKNSRERNARKTETKIE